MKNDCYLQKDIPDNDDKLYNCAGRICEIIRSYLLPFEVYFTSLSSTMNGRTNKSAQIFRSSALSHI